MNLPPRKNQSCAEKGADENKSHSLNQPQALDNAAIDAKRHADADLPGAHGGAGEDAVDADNSQQQGTCGKVQQRVHLEAPG